VNQVNSANTQQNLEFIVVLRAVSALLVVYSHLMGNWDIMYTDPQWGVIDFFRNYFSTPLGIIGGFGPLGVCIFFLISGFIITHTAQRETRFTFAVKRFLRIYPPFFGSTVIIFFVVLLFTNTPYIFQMHLRQLITPTEALLSTVMVNYLFAKPYIVNPVAWTLLVEVMFYGICVITLNLLKARPRLGILANLGICFLFMLTYPRFGTVGLNVVFRLMSVPYLIFGQIIYYLWAKRIDWRTFGALAIVCYIVIIYPLRTIDQSYYSASNSLPISFVYALAIFSGLLILNNRLKTPRVVRFLSTISYSLYLYHYLVGTFILVVLIPLIGYTFALPIAWISSIAVAYLSWRFVEKPSQQVARRLISQLKLGAAETDHQLPVDLPRDTVREISK
jgi:peptidoglycan/LPS O-acetylase OafA/YrhL